MKLLSRDDLAGDLWGGLASMMVALPASLAFGVAVYGALGAESSARGAVAGALGAAVLGLLAPVFGGTDRLVSAPCAPAAAVLGAFALQLAARGIPGDHVLASIAVAALLAGLLQVLYGLAGGGTLIKYIPYPVVTGYLTGVGVVLFLKQLPALFGWPHGTPAGVGLAATHLWSAPALVTGLVTIVATAAAVRLTRAVPGAIVGLAAGAAAYFAFALSRPELLRTAGNPLLVGPLGLSAGQVGGEIASRWTAIAGFGLADLTRAVAPALTLSVLLSIDTLKTCVVVDALTHTRHDSNREIVGQGIANAAAAALGGIPGAGTSGATLVNVASGGRTRRSGLLEGVFVVLAFVALGPVLAWAPLAALAGVLVVVAARMIDVRSLRLLRQRSTVLDFVVVAAVAVVAVGVGLVTASATGVGLAILLFLRDQVKDTVIHRRTTLDRSRSRQRRLEAEMAVLKERGHDVVVCELKGNLFFGTTDQLMTQLAPDLKTCRILVLDLRRVRSVDFTAVHILEQMHGQLAERGARIAYSGVSGVSGGRHLRDYLAEVGLLHEGGDVPVFHQVSDALEWAEDLTLAEAGIVRVSNPQPLELDGFDFLDGLDEASLAHLARVVEARSVPAGTRLFAAGDEGDEMFLVRRGSVRIVLSGKAGEYHVATLRRGDFLGDMAFLDRGRRSAGAVAATDSDLFVLSRARFDEMAESYPRVSGQLFAHLARVLAVRLRHADGEIRALQEG